MVQIKKAVIPVAGLGLNFLPTTKGTAKEMLPIVDKPIMQFVIEEAEAAGIEEFIVVTGRNKGSIENHFDANFDLEQNLKAAGKDALYEVATAATRDSIYYVRQPYPKGLGDAVLQARDMVGDEPFVVLLADNILRHDEPILADMLKVFEEYGQSIMGVQASDEVEDITSYGVVSVAESVSDHLFKIDQIEEKPTPAQAKNAYASIGRYVLTPEIFDYLENQEAGVEGLIHLTDALERLNQDKEQDVLAYQYDGTRYDVGDVWGYVKANLYYGLQHEETADELKEYIKDLADQLR